ARELARVKTQYVASRIYARDSLFAQAQELGSLEMVGLDHGDADRIIDRIRTIEAEDVRRVAQRYFGDDTLTVATLVPQPPQAQPDPLQRDPSQQDRSQQDRPQQDRSQQGQSQQGQSQQGQSQQGQSQPIESRSVRPQLAAGDGARH
ncbi:MAG: insulinase family protein, partial [Burkholderiales bacterium]